MKLFLRVLFLIACNLSFSNVRLPNVFGDHIVLQQNENVTIWGWASPFEKISISPSWSSENYNVIASNLATWKVSIKTPSAGGPYTIKIQGNNQLILKDVLIGEVWLCSGQSNMEMSAEWGINNKVSEVENANNTKIRFFNVPKTSSSTLQNNVFGKWEVCTSETMMKSSALAYFFAQKLQKKLEGIPIGIITSAWGGTPAEIWMPKKEIEEDAVLLKEANKLQPVQWGPVKPGSAFNAMIYPLIDFKIAGVLWYQGESNVGSLNYDKTFATLIKSWRKLWKKEFPFFYVQIAPYNYENKFEGVEIRDAQRKVLNVLPKLGMVVTSDISTSDDIHPKDKKTVGERLANIAMSTYYKKDNQTVEGPLFDHFSVIDNRAIVYFKNAKGLYVKNKKSQFEIAGDDGVYYVGEIKIIGEKVEVKSKKVKKPKYVRFSWSNTIQSNLFNGEQLPASSFKSN